MLVLASDLLSQMSARGAVPRCEPGNTLVPTDSNKPLCMRNKAGEAHTQGQSSLALAAHLYNCVYDSY